MYITDLDSKFKLLFSILIGNGVKILTASTSMAPNTPVIECKGRLMLASQYKAPNKKHVQPPYVFFYQVGDVLEICLDGKTYGNDGRFCRRSAAFNAELKHVIDKGSLHLFIVFFFFLVFIKKFDIFEEKS